MRLGAGSVPAADILIVDSDPVALTSLTRLLASQGHWVLQAKSAQEALSMAAVRMPDLVVAEVMMLGLDGIELARGLRASPVMADLPILLASERDDRETRVRASEVADDFLVKPIDGLELMFRVNYLLRSRARTLQLHHELARLSAENERLHATLADAMAQRSSFERCDEGAVVRLVPAPRR